MLCCCPKSDSDDESFQNSKVKPTKYTEVETNGVKTSPEREVTLNQVTPIVEPELEKQVKPVEQRELTQTVNPNEGEATHGLREGSPESQISLAQQEVADLKQVILQELQSNSSDEMSQQALISAVDRLEAVAIRLESLAGKGGASPSASASSVDSGEVFFIPHHKVSSERKLGGCWTPIFFTPPI